MSNVSRSDLHAQRFAANSIHVRKRRQLVVRNDLAIVLPCFPKLFSKFLLDILMFR